MDALEGAARTERTEHLIRLGRGEKPESAGLGTAGRKRLELAGKGLPLLPAVFLVPAVVAKASAEGRWPSELREEIRAALGWLKMDLVSMDAGLPYALSHLGLSSARYAALEKKFSPAFLLPRYAEFLRRFLMAVWPDRFEEFRKKDAGTGAAEAAESRASGERYWRQRVSVLEEFYRAHKLAVPESAEEQVVLALESLLRQKALAPGAEIVLRAKLGGSGHGVCYNRDLYDGGHALMGSYWANGQAAPLAFHQQGGSSELPEPLFKQLSAVAAKLEDVHKEIYEIPFVVEGDHVLIEEPAVAGRSARATTGLILDLLEKREISDQEAVNRIGPDDLKHLLVSFLDRRDKSVHLSPVPVKATPVWGGAATGHVYFSAEALAAGRSGDEPVILITEDFLPDQFKAVQDVRAIVTVSGGVSSHAAILSRMKSIPCAVGLRDAKFPAKGRCSIGDAVLHEGEFISLEVGDELQLYRGKGLIVPFKANQGRMPQITALLDRVLAASGTSFTVRANADTAEDARAALSLGAQGVGLCRTEHLCLQGEGLKLLRDIILNADSKQRQQRLRDLGDFHAVAFTEIMRVMKGMPVTIRLLDAPLHEFFAGHSGNAPHETNPMLGLRGCRLGLLYPEIYDTQIKAVLVAAARLRKEGVAVLPEILVPLVMNEREFLAVRQRVVQLEQEMIKEEHLSTPPPPIPIGTMIELPSAALGADRLARSAEFVSFGTNDLTQMTYGLSRDDASLYLPRYVELGLMDRDPFVSLGEEVKDLVVRATSLGRFVRRDLKVGLCGEQGGTEDGVVFCLRTGLDYVSCAPMKIPVAKLSLAKALLQKPG